MLLFSDELKFGTGKISEGLDRHVNVLWFINITKLVRESEYDNILGEGFRIFTI